MHLSGAVNEVTHSKGVEDKDNPMSTKSCAGDSGTVFGRVDLASCSL